LGENAGMIYKFDKLEFFTSEMLTETIDARPQEQREKALRFRFEDDRKLFVISYLILKSALKNEYGITDPLEYEYEEKGKPNILGHADIHFNISHCKNGVVVAVADAPIGIDIECIERMDLKVARRVCNEEEYDNIIKSKDPKLEFCKLWTIKEAIVKQSGQGISTNLKNIISTNLNPVETFCQDDYCISICKSQ
jgi:4'-phosphopantetheinyl transferase